MGWVEKVIIAATVAVLAACGFTMSFSGDSSTPNNKYSAVEYKVRHLGNSKRSECKINYDDEGRIISQECEIK